MCSVFTEYVLLLLRVVSVQINKDHSKLSASTGARVGLIPAGGQNNSLHCRLALDEKDGSSILTVGKSRFCRKQKREREGAKDR